MERSVRRLRRRLRRRSTTGTSRTGTAAAIRLSDLTAAEAVGGDTDVRVAEASALQGRHWATRRRTWSKLDRRGRICYPDATGMPRSSAISMSNPGLPSQDVWTDIDADRGPANERLGYPTQKPLALLERIISASQQPRRHRARPVLRLRHGPRRRPEARTGDGSASTSPTSHRRHASTASRTRSGWMTCHVIGQPTEVEGARQLAQSPEGRYQFQWWALALVDAKPLGGVREEGLRQGHRRPDHLHRQRQRAAVAWSCRSSAATSTRAMVRDLKGTIEREKAAIGLFVTLEEPTQGDAAGGEHRRAYHSELWNRDYPRLQVLSIRELLEEGKKPSLPPFVLPTYRRPSASRAGRRAAGTVRLGLPAASGSMWLFALAAITRTAQVSDVGSITASRSCSSATGSSGGRCRHRSRTSALVGGARRTACNSATGWPRG